VDKQGQRFTDDGSFTPKLGNTTAPSIQIKVNKTGAILGFNQDIPLTLNATPSM